MPISQSNKLAPVKEESLRRSNVNRSSPGALHMLDGRDSDHRHIESHILIRLGNLHNYEGFSTSHFSCAKNDSISSFHGFDRNYGAILHRDCLTKIEAPNLSRHAEAI